jgi:hypothetical protein
MFRNEIKLDWCWSCDFPCQFVYDEKRNNWFCKRCGKGLLHWDPKILEEVQWKNDDGGIMGVCESYQREHPRFVVELPIDYSRADRVEEYGGFAANASERGLLVYLPEFIEEKETLLRIVIPFVEGLEFNTIKCMAKVVWGGLSAKAAWGKHRYGLEILSFSRGSFDKLKMLLREVAKTNEGKEQ